MFGGEVAAGIKSANNMSIGKNYTKKGRFLGV